MISPRGITIAGDLLFSTLYILNKLTSSKNRKVWTKSHLPVLYISLYSI